MTPIRLPSARFVFLAALALALFPRPLAADSEPRPVLDAARLQLALERLGVVGSALYVAAHPDDENTAFLAWLADGRKVRAGYLSLTRGDGGQNLVGPETGELLGVIRTHELLGARRLDGAQQFFTRAIDFGYSKSADETLEIWGRERILADVVWVIRRFRPDVIVTRFPSDGAGGHGHHTASGILAEEAFAAAADSARFPEQLRWVRPWQARRLMWNVFRFGAQGPDTVAGRVRVDLGAYDPLLGRSYTEIAGESRSMHKSQGFGSAERRGSFTNSLEPRLGEPAQGDLFDGIDLTWARVPGGAAAAPLFAQAAREFQPDRPHAIVPLLLRARAALAGLPDDPLVAGKRAELDEVIRSCLGLWLEAVASAPSVAPGGRVRVVTAALSRSEVPVTLRRVEILEPAAARETARPLAFNSAALDTFTVAIPAAAEPTRLYWLDRPMLRGSFEVADSTAIGAPENPPVLSARFTLEVGGETGVPGAAPLAFDVPVVYRWTDPVQGERYREFTLAPAASVRFEQGAYLFPDGAPRELRVVVQAADRPVQGALRLRLPEGWSAQPPAAAVALGRADAETTVAFRVTPAAGPAASTVTAEMAADGRAWTWRSVTIDYPHIPLQKILRPAEARLVRADVRVAGGRVGYLMGSGDAIPEALRQMGFAVTLLSDEDVQNGDLAAYDAIVTGVRAYNTRPRLRALQGRLLDYVARGGRLVVQYSTAEDGLQDRLGPFPFRISRDRVTVEEARVSFPRADHPLLQRPNRITSADFEGWVQERGLYFANPWDAKYDTVLASNDPGEPPRGGGLLYARHGKGVFIYAAYAWFRQLPAGVPGAYRLFANLVSATPR